MIAVPRLKEFDGAVICDFKGAHRGVERYTAVACEICFSLKIAGGGSHRGAVADQQDLFCRGIREKFVEEVKYPFFDIFSGFGPFEHDPGIFKSGIRGDVAY